MIISIKFTNIHRNQRWIIYNYNWVRKEELETNTSLYLSYKHLGQDYDEKEIHSLIKETEYIEFELNFRLYQLLEDTSYLETAYNQVQEKASAMEEELAVKFLSYPMPKAIVEEWEKVLQQ